MRAVGVRYLPAVQFGDDYLEFAISTQTRRAHPNYPAEFDIYIDADGDGQDDYVIYNGEAGGFVATGGAALAVVAALFVGLVIYRELDLKHLRQAILEGGVQTAIVMLLVATSALLGNYLTEVQAPQALAKAVSDFTSNKWVVLALLNVLFLFLGMFLHSAAAIILVVPVVMPLVKSVGIDPVHFGLIVTINLGIGQQTPPVASVLMVASSIAKASVWEVSKVNVWFIGVLVAVLMLVTYVPVTGLGLVELFYR